MPSEPLASASSPPIERRSFPRPYQCPVRRALPTLTSAVVAIAICLLGSLAAFAERPPSKARQGTTPSADGVEIAYTVREPAEPDGNTSLDLVFVHGWACDQSFWREQVDAFSDRHRVVTLDLAGHGLSGTERKAWSLESFGPDIAAVVKALDLRRVVLIGHSMGGPATLEAAPLIADRMVGLIGVDTFHDAEFRVPAEQWKPFVDAYRQDFEGTCRQATKAMVGKAGEPLLSRVSGEMCDAPREIAIALMEVFGSYSSAASMAKVEAPVRSINAGGGMPTRIENNRKYAADFDAVIVPEVGHFLMLEAPKIFNRHLRDLLSELDSQTEDRVPGDG